MPRAQGRSPRATRGDRALRRDSRSRPPAGAFKRSEAPPPSAAEYYGTRISRRGEKKCTSPSTPRLGNRLGSLLAFIPQCGHERYEFILIHCSPQHSLSLFLPPPTRPFGRFLVVRASESIPDHLTRVFGTLTGSRRWRVSFKRRIDYSWPTPVSFRQAPFEADYDEPRLRDSPSLERPKGIYGTRGLLISYIGERFMWMICWVFTLRISSFLLALHAQTKILWKWEEVPWNLGHFKLEENIFNFRGHPLKVRGNLLNFRGF